MGIGTIAGVDGSLRWGYHSAASLKAWTIAKHEDGTSWTLTATIVEQDAFRLTQRPIVFEARHQMGVWRWPVVELQTGGAALTARLGPKGS